MPIPTDPEHLELAERLLKLSVVVEQTPASVIITDMTGKIEYVNPAFERITGYTANEVTGRNPSILKSGLMPKELYQEMWGKITSGEVWNGEICNRKKNGELFWELGTVSPIHNQEGLITNYISVKEDITERKRNEEELNLYRHKLEDIVDQRTAALQLEIIERERTAMMLREKEQELALALRLGQLGSWEYDFTTRQITFAEEVYKIFSLSPSGNRINYETVLALIHPDDQASVRKALNDAILSIQPLSVDHRILLSDGTEGVINLTAVPFADSQGLPIKMVGTIQDITERVRVKVELLEKERMINELNIGRSIQLGMLPKHNPVVEGWQIASFYQAASQVGGDFYDFVVQANGKVGFVVADVSGKGVPAALYMALSRAIVRTNALMGHRPETTLMRSNKILFRDYFHQGFVSVLYACLDPKTGTMDIANAGHCYPLWYSSELETAQLVKTQGTVIGLFPEITLKPVRVDIKPGDMFLFYTDGLTEANNPSGDFFDIDRMVDSFNRTAGLPVEEILAILVKEWQNFTGGLPQADDLTLVVIKRNG